MKEHDHPTGEARKTCKGLFFSVFSVSVWFNSGFQDEDLSERVDAFAARFGRLQDALSDKLLPARFALAGEPPRPAVEVLDRAERLGLIASADAILAVRKLHNRLVRAYVEDRDEPAVNPDAAHAFVPHPRCALQNRISHRRSRAWRRNRRDERVGNRQTPCHRTLATREVAHCGAEAPARPR